MSSTNVRPRSTPYIRNGKLPSCYTPAKIIKRDSHGHHILIDANNHYTRDKTVSRYIPNDITRSRILRKLECAGLLRRISTGKYTITRKGKSALNHVNTNGIWVNDKYEEHINTIISQIQENIQ